MSYRYILDGDKVRPDPASRFQPEGVHGPSALVDPEAFQWTDRGWTGLAQEDLILYELHTGTFTKDGTFEAIIPLLDALKHEVGVTAIEIMPVAQFPGRRNWGYDGVAPFAVQNSYGGPQGLKRLVDACHARGLGVVLDVVYNHLGPEGNYLNDFGPYFTDYYRTPWGQAVNFDGPYSDDVRAYFVSNALYWVSEYHMDGLRLDAIHGIYDRSARHILAELAEAVHREAAHLGRSVQVIAESDLNDARIITPPARGGYGLDAQWSDDFHHALHTLLTGERTGYYEDFGRLDQLATALREGFIYAGQHSPHRRRRHGNSARRCRPSQFVVAAQNHDQVGNRACGERLASLAPFEALKVAAAALLLSPNLPLLFMGEEYGETAPFLYFTDHGDPALVEAVRKGRREEFAAFNWAGEVPDPQDPATFERSRVHPGGLPEDPRQAALLRWYRRLIALRRSVPALGAADSPRLRPEVRVHEAQRTMVIHRKGRDGSAALILLGFHAMPATVPLKEPDGAWRLVLDSAAEDFGGPGASTLPAALELDEGRAASVTLPARAAAVYLKESPDDGR
jgi:maltooligosyltrehalose trehalohydrolase